MKSGETMSKNKPKESGQSKFLVFFMVILIPAVFALILAVVLAFYFGFGDQLQRLASVLPFIEEPQEEMEDASESGEESEEGISDEEYILQLENDNETYLQEITRIETELNSKDEEIASLQEELVTIQSEDLGIEGEEPENGTTDINDIVKTLEEMTSSKAADIIGEIPQDEAITYLRIMQVNSRSEILSKMDAEAAAGLLSKMSN